MKITQGDWKLIPGSTCIQDDQLRNIAYVNYVDMPTDEEIGRDEAEANAALIVEAGTVHNETGYTPRQLADQKQDLLTACKLGLLAFCAATKAMKVAGLCDEDSERQDREVKLHIEAAIAGATN